MKNINEETTAGGNFSPLNATSGAFPGGIKRKRKRKQALKTLVNKLDEIWLKHTGESF